MAEEKVQPKMMEPISDGTRATLDYIMRELTRLDETKATVESVANLKESLEDLKDAFADLKRILITVALSWVGGTGLFLIAVLTITRQ